MIDELLPFVETPKDDELLRGRRHVELLYSYRNHLVHEFREPGYDRGVLGDDVTPYYMGMITKQGNGVWELAYPTNFFAWVTERALANLRTYLEVNHLDPYAFYRFGSPWRRK